MAQDLTTIFTLRAPDKAISTIAIDHFAEVEKLDDKTRASYLKTVKNGLRALLKAHPEYKDYKMAHVNNNNLLRIPGVKGFPKLSEFIQMLDLGDETFDSYMLLPHPYEKALELIYKVPGYDAFPTDRFIRVDLLSTDAEASSDVPVVDNTEDNASDEGETVAPSEEAQTADTDEEVETVETDEADEAESVDAGPVPMWYKRYKTRTIIEGTVDDLLSDDLAQATILAVGTTILTRKITAEQFKEALDYMVDYGYNPRTHGFAILPASRNYINQFAAQVEAWEKLAQPIEEFTGREFPVNLDRQTSRTTTLTGEGSGLKLYIN